MLYLFYGTDTTTVRAKAIAAADATGFGRVRIDAESFVENQVRDAVGSVSLFGEHSVYVIDMPSHNATLNTETLSLLSEMSAASDVFVVIEGALLAAAKKQWQKYATVAEEYTRSTAERFNSFALADALAGKDKKSLWLLLADARHQGLAAEELIGVLWWQLKTLRLAAITRTATEAGMKDFPYNKAKRSLKNFKPQEIETLSLSLLKLYHAGHNGEKEIFIGLEEWVLEM